MPRTKPVLIYDGECGFCKKWIALWQRLTGDSLDYGPSQELSKEFPQIPVATFDQSVVLVFPSGKILKGAEAVFASLSQAHSGWLARLLWKAHTSIPVFRRIVEWAYRLVARRRIFFSHLTYWLLGDELEPSTYQISRWLFLRVLSAIYFVAFSSLGLQLLGLVGSQGIFKAHWSDGVLRALQVTGMVSSILLFLGLAPMLNLMLLWGLYWFFADLTKDFLWFQWDGLLLEMGLLAIVFAPFTFWPASPLRPSKEREPSKVLIFLFRWLLFKVMFFSGWVKLASGDPNWANLTAVTFHYESQPIPTWLSWYMHQLPEWFHVFSAGVMFVIELGVPFLIFFPRRPRIWVFWIFVFFQGLLDVTGNYGFFGWQVVALCLLLLDDQYWRGFVPKRWFPSLVLEPESRFKRVMLVPLGAILLSMNWFYLPYLSEWASHYRVVNHYGVFATMTTQRDEIVIEGSRDGQEWLAYELKWKPGDLSRPPPFVEPHMPRLDWQMWFAALSQYEQQRWFPNLMYRLLQGSPAVTALFENNPFGDRPPQYVRALRYEYHFTDWEERASSGHWWRRRYVQPYSPVFSLDMWAKE